MDFISKCTADTISNAARALIDGHLVAFPTETVYGLGADATNEKAVSRIYSVKRRPSDHPLIVHISSINKLDQWATDIPDYAIKLAREFWPGPMTLILPRTDLAKDFITGGQKNVGLRVPAQPIALALLKKFEELGGQGVAAPSANRFGAVSPTTSSAVVDELAEYLNQTDLILDGGSCLVGIESTIIDCSNESPKILRLGPLTKNQINEFFNQEVINSSVNNKIKVSGSFKKHYSPKAKVLINKEPLHGDGMYALKVIETPPGVIRIGSPANPTEFARDLYSAFRNADKLQIQKIVIYAPAGTGIEEAIMERIQKAQGE
jgi:L-threonylcarbamoyladenylate synthase